MLLRRDGDGLIAIGQPAHAWVSGQLARAWGNDAFGAVEPWEEVCLAAEQHDIGMAAWERRPSFNAETGLPRSFMELTLDEHLGMWSAAAGLVVPQSRYAALLVSMHGIALYELRDLARLSEDDAGRVREFMAAQRALQDALRRSLGADEELLRRNQRLVWTWDSLSLGLLLRWPPWSLRAVPTAAGEADVAVATARSTRGRSPRRGSACAARAGGSRARTPARRRCTMRSRPRGG